MKKIFAFIAAMAFTSAMMTSCLKDDDSKSTADIFYAAKTDSLNFTDPSDSVWTQNIVEAIAKLGVTYTTIEVLDTCFSSQQYYQIVVCNQKAANIYNDMQKKLTLSDVKKAIYNAHADSLVKLGYNQGADSLPIHKFKHWSSLWNLYTGAQVCYYDFMVE